MTARSREIGYGVLAGVGAFAASLAVYKGVRYLCNKHKGAGKEENPHFWDSDEYMLKCFGTLHYAAPEDYLLYPCVSRESLDFHKKCAELCMKHKMEGVVSRAVDVGCGAGRTSFELTRGFEEVVGIDISQAFVDKCNEIKRTGQTEYWLPKEGELGETKVAKLDTSIDRSRVRFMVGDACNLPALGQVGCIFTANTLCRVPDPAQFLEQARDLLAPNGILVLVESYTWTEETTPKDKWLGGYKDKDGHDVDTFENLKKLLGPHFDLQEECVLQCLSRDASHLFLWFIDHATVWRKKEEAA